MSYQCHPENACSGKKYGRCLDVKLTGKCQAQCTFCIERGGYAPDAKMNYCRLAKRIVEHKANNILLVGGEPLLYPKLGQLIRLIKQEAPKKKLFLTTNGIALNEITLHPDLIEDMGLALLDTLNISIHSAEEKVNNQILHCKGPDFKRLRVALQKLPRSVSIRINCNLVRGGVDSDEKVIKMISLAKGMFANEIRFTELQDVSVEEGFIFAKSLPIFRERKMMKDDPFSEGCVHTSTDWAPLLVSVKSCCGYVCPEKIRPSSIDGYDPKTWVLYPDGTCTKGWMCFKKANKKNHDDEDEELEDSEDSSSDGGESFSCHGSSCHGRHG